MWERIALDGLFMIKKMMGGRRGRVFEKGEKAWVSDELVGFSFETDVHVVKRNVWVN